MRLAVMGTYLGELPLGGICWPRCGCAASGGPALDTESHRVVAYAGPPPAAPCSLHCRECRVQRGPAGAHQRRRAVGLRVAGPRRAWAGVGALRGARGQRRRQLAACRRVCRAARAAPSPVRGTRPSSFVAGAPHLASRPAHPCRGVGRNTGAAAVLRVTPCTALRTPSARPAPACRGLRQVPGAPHARGLGLLHLGPHLRPGGLGRLLPAV